MNQPAPSVWLHRFAWFTAALTLLLPVATGSVVTTIKAGMIFADWPTSDGYFMLSYPWLKSARDQFVEHGHRLSGSLVGLVSLLLVIFVMIYERRPSIRLVAGGIFLSVFVQGLLGGARVLSDKQTMALVHGDFAALVFSLMAILVVITSKGWEQRTRLTSKAYSTAATRVATLLLVVLSAQYVMGGFLRHLQGHPSFAWARLIHPWFAIAVVVTTLLFVLVARKSGSPALRRCASTMVTLAVVQSLIGLATWYYRHGVPEWGVVAVQDSLPQIIICSLHTIVGMTAFMTSVVTVFCCLAVAPLLATQPKSPAQTDVMNVTSTMGVAV